MNLFVPARLVVLSSALIALSCHADLTAEDPAEPAVVAAPEVEVQTLEVVELATRRVATVETVTPVDHPGPNAHLANGYGRQAKPTFNR